MKSLPFFAQSFFPLIVVLFSRMCINTADDSMSIRACENNLAKLRYSKTKKLLERERRITGKNFSVRMERNCIGGGVLNKDM